MAKYTEKIIDAITGEESIIERDFTKEEIAAQKAFEAEMDAANKQMVAKNALLEKLGITEEEAKLLLS